MTYEEKTRQLVEEIANTLNIENNFPKLEMYVKTIIETNKVMNLTGFKGDILWEKGIYESISMMYQIFKNENFENKQILDIGAGVGFPSLPFKIIYPFFSLTIHESHNKRANFLKAINEKLELNINIKTIRTEEDKTIEHYDIITARAVGSSKILAEISSKILKINGSCFFLKGPSLSNEIKEAKYIMHQLNYDYQIIENSDNNITSKLVLLHLIKTKKTPKQYPRYWAIIKNNK